MSRILFTKGVPGPGWGVPGPGWGVPGLGGTWSGGLPGSGGVPAPGGCLVQGVPGPGGGAAPGGVCSPGVGAWSGEVPGGEPLPDSYCCGQYASYWNAFLLKVRSHESNVTSTVTANLSNINSRYLLK